MCDVIIFNKPDQKEWEEVLNYARQFQARGLFGPTGVFKEKQNEISFPETPPPFGIIHCRVPTSGSAFQEENNQPFTVNSKYGQFVGCQTGFISLESSKILKQKPKGKCDSEIAIIALSEKQPISFFQQFSQGQLFWEHNKEYYTLNASWGKISGRVAISTSIYGNNTWECCKINFKNLSQTKVNYNEL